MSRSTKKGYFVQEALMKKVKAQNDANEFSRNSLVTQLLSMTDTSSSLYTLQRTWSVTSSANLLLHASSAVTPAMRRQLVKED